MRELNGIKIHGDRNSRQYGNFLKRESAKQWAVDNNHVNYYISLSKSGYWTVIYKI
jgi:hypothetical protein